MATSLVPSPPQLRAEFGVGASIAAAAIGVSDYRGPVDAWLECTGRTEPWGGNEKSRWGQTLEPVIRAHYIEKNRAIVWVPPTSLFHDELPFVRATPDGIVLDRTANDNARDIRESWAYVGPQVKNVGLRMAPLWVDGAIPPDYFIQGVVEMAVAKLPRIDFAVLIGGQEYREVTIWRDAELEAQTLDSLAGFWNFVETNTQPAIDGSTALKRHLLRQIKRQATIEASSDAIALMERWRTIVREISARKKAERTVKNQLVAVLSTANATRLTSELGDITIGAPFRKTAWKDVAEELRFHAATLLQVERELIALRADLANEPGGEIHTQRIDAIRSSCRLTAGIETFDELVKRHTALGDPVVRRPNGWTKDVNESEEHEG